MTEALKEQYGQVGGGINKEDMYVMSGKNKRKPVEMVGTDSVQEKQRYLQKTIQSMKFSNSFVAHFLNNFIFSGTSF